MSDELSHDTHLRTALRHAPDHALAPPAGVSQAILNAARHVHKPARPAATPAPAVRITVAPPRAVALLRQWFASPRLAGGLATGLVAALGLGLWLDLEREPVIDRAPAPAVVESRSGDATSAAPAAPAPAAHQAAEPGVAAGNAHMTPTVPAPSATTEAPSDAARAKRPRSTEAKAERGSRAAAPEREARESAKPVPERHEAGGAQEAAGALAKSAPPLAAAPAPAPAPAPATAPAPAPAPEAGPATTPASVASPAPTAPAPPVTEAVSSTQRTIAQAAEKAQRDAAARSDTRMSLAAGRAATLAGAPPSAVADGAAAADAAASPAVALLRRARSEQASSAARWTWMPPGKAAIVPLDAQAEAWLLRVAQASRARWSDSTERSAPGDALEVRWWRDDWPQATLRIEADGLRWIEHSGRMHHAPLDTAALQRLRSP